MKTRLVHLMAALVVVVLTGCSGHWAETSKEFDGGCWSVDDTLKLEFDNEDTSKVFMLGFPIVVSEEYAFHNIYLKAILKAPSGDESSIPGEFILADPSGVWLSEPSGDQITFQLNVGEGLRFNQKGKYSLRLFHYMRDDLLCGVQQAGITLDPMVD